MKYYTQKPKFYLFVICIMSACLFAGMMYYIPNTVQASPLKQTPTTLTEDGIITGKVINGTMGNPHGNIPVTLQILDHSGNTIDTIKIVTTNNGLFIFENVKRSTSMFYLLDATYNDISFPSSEFIQFQAEETMLEHDLTVYETTPNPESLYQSRLHRIISYNLGFIDITDVYVFGNSGKHAFVGEMGTDKQHETIKIMIPVDATAIKFENNTIRPSAGYYADSQPILPGEDSYMALAQYSIPIDQSEDKVEITLFYNISNTIVLAENAGPTIQSEQLILQGVETMEGEDYQLLRGADFKADESFTIMFGNLDSVNMPVMEQKGSTSPSTPTRNDQTVLLWAILGLCGAVLGFSLYYTVQYPQKNHDTSLAEEKVRLLALLTELDKIHHDGNVDENMYQKLRSENRALLKDVLQKGG